MTSPPPGSDLPLVFAPVVSRLEADAAAYFGTPAVCLRTIDFQERPFSFVARISVQRGDGAPLPNLFVKAVKSRDDAHRELMRGRVAHEFEVTQRAFAGLRAHATAGVVPPVACYPEHLVIATEQVDGTTLLDEVGARASWLASGRSVQDLCATMSNVGQWLRAFQSLDGSAGRVPGEWFKEYIDSRLQRLARGSGGRFGEPDRQRVLRHIDALTAHTTPRDLEEVAIHADLALGNVLVSGSRVVVLDFAMAKRGGRLHDLTRLYVQLDLLAVKPQLRGPTIRRAQAALVEGFDPTLSPTEPVFRLYMMLHHVNHYASLILKPASFPTSWYNHFVLRRHRDWIEGQLSSLPASAD